MRVMEGSSETSQDHRSWWWFSCGIEILAKTQAAKTIWPTSSWAWRPVGIPSLFGGPELPSDGGGRVWGDHSETWTVCVWGPKRGLLDPSFSKCLLRGCYPVIPSTDMFIQTIRISSSLIPSIGGDWWSSSHVLRVCCQIPLVPKLGGDLW